MRKKIIEPGFSHLKSDNRMQKNYLKGEHGDHLNAIFAACGYNMRKLLKAFSIVFKKFLAQAPLTNWSKILKEIHNMTNTIMPIMAL